MDFIEKFTLHASFWNYKRMKSYVELWLGSNHQEFISEYCMRIWDDGTPIFLESYREESRFKLIVSKYFFNLKKLYIVKNNEPNINIFNLDKVIKRIEKLKSFYFKEGL